MILSDDYRKRLFEIAGIILENRIEKLRREKYPEEIINFVIEFSKLTTRDPSNEESVFRNQYIPWIAQEVRRNPKISNEKDKLEVIVNWIKNANYPPISTIESFDLVFEKAKNWLAKRNIDPSSGERVEGGRIEKTYPNKFRWIRVTNTNWCMNVGEKHGWCFSDPSRAEAFVGLGEIDFSNRGYMLLDAKDKPLLAIQYDPVDKRIVDIQAPFNRPAKPTILLYGFDMFKKIGEITDIKSHQDNFWKALKSEPKLAEALLGIPSVKLSLSVKLNHQLKLTPTERATLDINALLKYRVPLTAEEIIRVPIELKLKYNIPLSDQEKELLRKSKDMFVAKVRRAALSRSRAYEKIFSDEDFAGYVAYEFDYDNRAVKLDIKDNEFDEKFSGLGGDDLWAYNNVNSYDYYEEADSEEVKYMYGFLNDANKKLLKKIASELGVSDYDFEKEGNLAKFLKDYTDIKDIEDDFLHFVSSGWERNAKKNVNEVVDAEQKFKYINGYLILPFKELYKFVAEHPEENIKSFNGLKSADINGEIAVLDAYQDSLRADDESYEEINKMFKSKLAEFIDKIKSGEISISTRVQEAHEILRNLGFKKIKEGTYGGQLFAAGTRAVKKKGRFVFITGFNFEEQKFDATIVDFGDVKHINKDANPEKVLKIRVPFDKLADYVYQYELFENMNLRKLIRVLISEDFRYLYDRKSFIPPSDVAQAASNALSLNSTVSVNSGGNEGSGTQKAKSLASREPMNHAQLKRMKAFFDNNEVAVRNELSQGKNINNSGLIRSWNLWGGDAGKRWVERQIASVQSTNKTSKKIRNPEDGVRTKTLMDPHNTRIRRGGSVASVSESTVVSSDKTFGTVGDAIYYDGKHIANVVSDVGTNLFYINYEGKQFRSAYHDAVIQKLKKYLGLNS